MDCGAGTAMQASDIEPACIAFARVAVANPARLHEAHFVLAGMRVHVRIVGHLLAQRLTETFAHLATTASSGPAGLQIEAWDENETGIIGPRLSEASTPGWEAPMDGGTLAVSADENTLVFRLGRSVTCLDRRAARIVAWTHDAARLLLQERTKPFGPLLALWLRDRGLRMMHAAAVVRDGRAVLLIGPTGSGKSTSAALCVEAGLGYLGDDAAALEECGDGAFVAHSLYGGARLLAADTARFPHLAQHAVVPDGDLEDPKVLIFLHRTHADQLQRRARITAVAFPRVAGGVTTRVRRLSGAQALGGCAAGSLFMWVRPDASDVDQLTRLVTTVPAYALELGTELSAVAPHIAALLERSA
jgi:hypothetical protein